MTMTLPQMVEATAARGLGVRALLCCAGACACALALAKSIFLQSVLSGSAVFEDMCDRFSAVIGQEGYFPLAERVGCQLRP